jgi:hypothetical protein
MSISPLFLSVVSNTYGKCQRCHVSSRQGLHLELPDISELLGSNSSRVLPFNLCSSLLLLLLLLLFLHEISRNGQISKLLILQNGNLKFSILNNYLAHA